MLVYVFHMHSENAGFRPGNRARDAKPREKDKEQRVAPSSLHASTGASDGQKRV